MSRKRKNILNKNKVNFRLNSAIMDLMINSFYSQNSNVDLGFYKKLNNFMELVDIDTIEDVDDQIKYAIIQSFLTSILDHHVSTTDMLEALLESDVGSNNTEQIAFIIENVDELSDGEFAILDRFISHRIQHAHYYKFVPNIQDLAVKLSSNNVKNFEAFNSEFELELARLLQEINKSKQRDLYSAWDLDTSDPETFLSRSSTIISRLKNPSSTIRTGIKELNNMLTGGFKSGRLYLFLAGSGVGKSGLLLNTAVWFKKFNKDIKANDPKKIPVALYISVENDMDETLERFYALSSDCDTEIDEFENGEDFLDEMTKAGIVAEVDKEHSEPHIVLKYRPKNSLGPRGVRAMIDELASEGKEVKLVSFDYIKKAKADEPTGDMRIDLGNISDGFSLLAKDYNIPFVTATQINRATVDNIMKAEGLEKQVKSANASGIGDSWMMAENSDVVIMAFKEIIEDENGGFKAYIALKLEKMRGKLKSAKKTFIHPFEANNDMKLMHDIFMKTSLSMDKMPDTNRNTPKMVMRGGKTLPLNKNIVSLDELDEDEDEADDYGIRRG